jgi:hypothetical protein
MVLPKFVIYHMQINENKKTVKLVKG